MYCEKCCRIIEEERCPFCRHSRIRQPEPDDPCFLTERNYLSSTMLEDVMKQNGIHFLKKEVLGAGLSVRVGPMLDWSRFYVPFAELEKASSIVEELFGAPPEDLPEEQDE